MIPTLDMEELIRDAYTEKNDSFITMEHPEFSDVNSRFRSLLIDGQTWIVKKSRLKDAETERSNALEVYRRINGIVSRKIRIEVIVPELYILDGDGYLISPYLGKTLQAKRYTDSTAAFSVAQLYSVLETIVMHGIAFRGFLPRNSFWRDDNSLVLIDWEEVILFNETPARLSLLWQTNYLLNWGYFFEQKDLIGHFCRLQAMGVLFDEPSLKRYEVFLGQVLGMETDHISAARSQIMSFVICAEKPSPRARAVYKFPNDCAHMVADLYQTEIDVFFDMVLFCLDTERAMSASDLIGSILEHMKYPTPWEKAKMMLVILCFAWDVLDSSETIRITGCSETLKWRLIKEAAAHHPVLKQWFSNDLAGFKCSLRALINQMTFRITGSTPDREAVEMIIQKIIDVKEMKL